MERKGGRSGGLNKESDCYCSLDKTSSRGRISFMFYGFVVGGAFYNNWDFANNNNR